MHTSTQIIIPESSRKELYEWIGGVQVAYMNPFSRRVFLASLEVAPPELSPGFHRSTREFACQSEDWPLQRRREKPQDYADSAQRYR
jgi:hypothetical protein